MKRGIISMATLSRRENVFLAKKNLIEHIYNSAYLEGCNVTFPQTQTLLEGAKISGLVLDDIQIILNLRDAWKRILTTLDEEITVEFICSVNERISYNESLAWGVLRTGSVGVSGTNWLPAIPKKDNVQENLNTLLLIENPLERAIEYCCYAIKNQLFWDGNKRTSLLVANKILIENGCGVLTISPDDAFEYNKALSHYYNTDDKEPFKRVLKNAVRTIDFEDDFDRFCNVRSNDKSTQR